MSLGKVRPSVARASERFEPGLDAPALSEYFDRQMAQMQRTFSEIEREVSSRPPHLTLLPACTGLLHHESKADIAAGVQMDADMTRMNERARQLRESEGLLNIVIQRLGDD